MAKVSFKEVWKIVKIVAAVQLFNALADYIMWVLYGFLVPSWTIATLSVGYIVVILGVKRALEKEKCEDIK
jgi:hypothetical protein